MIALELAATGQGLACRKREMGFQQTVIIRGAFHSLMGPRLLSAAT